MCVSNPPIHMPQEPKISAIKFSRFVIILLSNAPQASHTQCTRLETLTVPLVQKKNCKKSFSILLNYHLPLYSVHFPFQVFNNLSPKYSQLLYLSF